MAGASRFDCYPSDFLNGVIGLRGDEIAAYTVVIMLQYDRGFPVAYLGRERELQVRSGLTKGRLRKAINRLVEIDKLRIECGALFDCKVSIEIERRLRGRPEIEIWKKIRLEIFERDNFTCTYCGETDISLECDHIYPVSRGGTSELSNLTTSCFSCNRSKSNKTLEEWRG